MWLESHFREIQHVANDRDLLPLVQKLLALPRESEAILGSEALKQARALYDYHMSKVDAKGFFLIAPDRMSIGSMRDTNIGTRNLIAEQQPELMDRAFAGETVFIPPINSDVPLENASGRRVENAATMFFATPVRDPSRQVIAVLTLRFDPAGDFGRITRVARVGATGETYAFDRQARLLTASRFKDSLETELAPVGVTAPLLSLRIRDPGGNLLEGYQSRGERSEWPLTRMAQAAVGGRSGLDTAGYRNYLGVPVVGAWIWSDTLGIGLATEIDLAEALAPYRSMRTLVLGALLGITFIALALMAFSIWLGERTRSRLRDLVNERTDELRKIVQAVEQSPLCVVITSADGVIEHVNPTFTKVTGYEAVEVTGRNPRILKSGDTPPEQYDDLWKTILAGEVWHSEIRNRRKSGELYWGSISIAPVTNDEGEVTHFVAMTEDITEAKKVELALEASVERFRVLFDASADPYLILEGDWFTDCNQAAVDLLNYGDKADLLARQPAELSPEFQPNGETSKDKAEAMVAMAHSRGSHRFDWVHRKKDGEEFPVEITLTPIELDGKTVLLTVWHDLTERHKAEQSLRKSEEQFRTLVGNIPGVVYRCLPGHPWTMLFISDGVEVLSGYPASDFLGENPVRAFGALMHPDDIEPIARNTAEAVAERRPYINEYRVIDARGETHWVYAKGQAVYGAGGEPEYLDGTIFDISDRLKAEKRLRESEERLEAAASGANLGLWDFFPQKGEILANAAWASMLGYEPSVIRETDDKWSRIANGLEFWTQLIHPDDLESTRELIGRHLEGKTDIYRAEYRMRCADGSWKWILDAGQVTERDEDGRALRMNGVHADIDEPKRLQAELEKAKHAAEEATRAKSDFLANMSHEIRTPMNAIIGLSHLALGTALDRKQRDYLTKVHSSAKNLLGIINDILDFSKIEAGKLDMEAVDFDLAEVLDTLANVLSVKSGEKGLELIVDLDPEVPLGLKGDPLRLNQILINLANNAIKFTEVGEITIAARLVESSEDGVMLRFAVQDTGIGMTPEQQGRLFQAFSQADTSTTRKFGGTGLGLTISKRLTEMIGGEVGVESEYGEGSTFWFTARFGLGAEPKLRAQRALPEELQDLRVLVVDDHPTARTILARYLESFGFSTGEVASGAEAIDELERAELPYQLVLIDWKMPGMDGIEATRRIHQSGRIASQPDVIMVSAYGREELIEQAEAEGVKGFLVKPVSPSSLYDAILEAMGHGREHVSPTGGAVPTQELLRGARILLVEDNEINQQVAE